MGDDEIAQVVSYFAVTQTPVGLLLNSGPTLKKYTLEMRADESNQNQAPKPSS